MMLLNVFLSVAVAGFGLFGLAYQIRELIRARASTRWAVGEAIITDTRLRKGREPELSYRYSFRGREYLGHRFLFGYVMPKRGYGEAEAIGARFAVGTRWEVRICEARPELSVLHPGATRRLWFGLVFLSAFSIAGVGAFLSFVRELR
jgi:hypothetical protein